MILNILKRIIKEVFCIPFSLLLYRILSYPFPLRTAVIRIFTIILKYYRPHYYSILYEAVQSSIKLGYKKISCIEFGVANGNGLLSLEKYAEILSKKHNIQIEIFGFDIGNKGLPAPKDYKDLPHIWKKGFYAMNENDLKKKLKQSKLRIGNVNKTVSNFFNKHNPSPIACIFFYLDFYSSTKDSFKIFSANEKYFLPRILCYFDDIQHYVNNYNGPLLAINEFNKENDNKKIAQDFGSVLNYKYGCYAESVFTYHYFTHKKYNNYTDISVGKLD